MLCTVNAKAEGIGWNLCIPGCGAQHKDQEREKLL